MSRPDKKSAKESAELMYVKCAACGKWIDVKPGEMNKVSHGICPDCYRKEMDKWKNAQATERPRP
ncbi:MAG: hypothetical protein KA248_04005 [Kiritimatiellae bacterium]|nr:hypothetical protein [Kiritimatiellia bacterium]